MSAQPPYDLGEIAPHASLVQNYGRFPLRFVSGDGCWLTDDQGRRFLDGLAGIATCSLGHGHPALVAAIQRQAATLIHTSNLFHIPRQEELATLLCRHSGGQRVFFCNSGTEANEAVLKVVRRWGNVTHAGRKPRVIAAEHSFHGRTLGALALTGNPHYHEGFQPLAPIDFVPYGDVAALAAKMGDDVPEALKIERMDRVLSLQRAITWERYERWLGRDVRMLVDSCEGGVARGRTHLQADEIDGVTLVPAEATPGTFLEVRLTEVLDECDFRGELRSTIERPAPAAAGHRARRFLPVVTSQVAFGR